MDRSLIQHRGAVFPRYRFDAVKLQFKGMLLGHRVDYAFGRREVTLGGLDSDVFQHVRNLPEELKNALQAIREQLVHAVLD